MIKLKVSPSEAFRKIKLIEHSICNRGADKYWHVEKGKDGNNYATAQSICWLFCWAKTGQNSNNARIQAQKTFNEIFKPSFQWLESTLNHEDAMKWRYDGNLKEAEFYSHILNNSE